MFRIVRFHVIFVDIRFQHLYHLTKRERTGQLLADLLYYFVCVL